MPVNFATASTVVPSFSSVMRIGGVGPEAPQMSCGRNCEHHAVPPSSIRMAHTELVQRMSPGCGSDGGGNAVGSGPPVDVKSRPRAPSIVGVIGALAPPVFHPSFSRSRLAFSHERSRPRLMSDPGTFST